jgi:hypothetical protein
LASIELSQLESHLWEAANILRGPVDAADFKTYVFPLLFFKRISDVFDEEYTAALTLIGAESTQKGRHWNKDVDFVWHLTGAMRSISTCWKRQFKEMEPRLISEFPVHDAGEEHSLLDSLASQHAAADQRLIEQDEEDRVLAMFKHDPEATQVLQGLLDGLKKNAIMPRYGLDERRYAATVRRIRVKLLDRRNGVDRGDDHDR